MFKNRTVKNARDFWHYLKTKRKCRSSYKKLKWSPIKDFNGFIAQLSYWNIVVRSKNPIKLLHLHIHTWDHPTPRTYHELHDSW